MEVTKVPKKIVTVIEPKRSMTVDKENTGRREWRHTAESRQIAKNSSSPMPIKRRCTLR